MEERIKELEKEVEALKKANLEIYKVLKIYKEEIIKLKEKEA